MAKALEFASPFYAAGEFPFNDAIAKEHLKNEETLLSELLERYQPDQLEQEQILQYGLDLVEGIRKHKGGMHIETFLKEYGLDNYEGITLMCLAEALLRIPDNDTAERFLRDKLDTANWSQHLGHSDTFWVNFSTWGLVLTGKLLKSEQKGPAWFGEQVKGLIRKLGEPVALKALRRAMLMIGQQFVAGETISEAIQNNFTEIEKGYKHSYDMLGEAAMRQQDVDKYMEAYRSGILGVAEQHKTQPDAAAISIKLSALHPRFELRQAEGLRKLKDNLLDLLTCACENDVPVTIDAEETWRLEPQLKLFADVIGSEPFRHWGKLGLAVQAYQKRALGVLDWLISLSKSIHCQIPVRLVKGAYWDTEIKQAQLLGLDDYPVFTLKAGTDLSYLVCAQKLIKEKHFLLPQFATHNAHTVASILTFVRERENFNYEFQRLHGMGDALYDHLLANYEGIRCRVYAPVGHYKEVLPYLVRRLLENGANTSFVRLLNQGVATEKLIENPVKTLRGYERLRHPQIPRPGKLFSPERRNSRGLDLENSHTLKTLKRGMEPFLTREWHLNEPARESGDAVLLHNPADMQDCLGSYARSSKKDCHRAFDRSLEAQTRWRDYTPDMRADLLVTLSNLYEENANELMALAMREAGKTLANALGEVREAVDFCRYYALQARKLMSESTELKGPTGERNALAMEPRGTVLCISPWNFPLAIFTGQVTAALAAGNTVIAKPSTMTPLIAARAVELFHEAGFPEDVIQLLPCPAKYLEPSILNESRLSAVMFTGSYGAASSINRALAKRSGPIIPFVAETGGQNAMIVDSSALPEQVVKDIAVSAFDSAGQRCSALRVLYVQEDIKDRIINLLTGYMRELHVGDPLKLDTDIGPVINRKAKSELDMHIERFGSKGQLIYQCELDDTCRLGHFVAPALIHIDHINDLYDEVFGPVLHVISYKSGEIDQVIDQINGTGFGLTLGIHSRIQGFAQDIARRVQVGNVYINRNMIGATVGVQPFGGRGLSGTGPKAGGPHYLLRLMHEKSYSINTAAIGGNTTLLTDQ